MTRRILVALVAIPLIVYFSLAGGFLFAAMMVFISTLGLHEYYALAKKKGAAPQVATGLVFGILVSCVFVWDKLRSAILVMAASAGHELPMPSMAQLFLILFLLFGPFVFVFELFRQKGGSLVNAAVTVFGVCYVPFFLGSLIGLRELFIPADFPVWAYFDVNGIDYPPDVVKTIYDWGGATVLTVFVSIWMCDSLAYFAGRAFGRHKLFERVSPNKTWEGAVAGYTGAVATFVLSQQLFLPYMTVGSALVCGSIIGFFGQVGDLAESMLKRDAGVKDSSSLIPGHGGVLDRFDSLIFVSPLIFFYLDFVVF